MSDVPVTPGEKKRHRSPAYPSIALPKAIEYAGMFWKNENHHPARVSVAAVHFGFTEKSSAAQQVVAAMTYFGLLEHAGGMNEARTVKLTELAKRILANNASSPIRIAALKEAAVLPKLHAELLQKYGDQLPSDQTIRNYLTFDRAFSESGAAEAVRVFRESLSLANMYPSGTMSIAATAADDTQADLPEDDMATEPTPTSATQVPSAGRAHAKPSTPMHGGEEGETERLRFNLKGGRRVRLMFTGYLPTQADINKLIQNLELNKDTFPEDAPEE